ncbi:hypothetical protein [Plantactinospora sp. KLBMP9567]|uniref:hypothetical protein n=1 Tax=Plantactinospora sp. KLBMP9567 TaxID=3085900 RepID=UPI002981A56F|nr:hypothetical protein [Plantactinospora sp. KLBMP9567]MDW5323160.1 hypothetical protein [Plantactinospora sp. KLBMP9567]
MASFAEYAALARHLHELRRSGERTAAQLAEAQGSTGAAADRLDQRLAVQQQRLTALGQMIGKSVPSAPPAGPALPGPPPPAGYPPPGSGGHPTVPAQYAGPDHVDPSEPSPPAGHVYRPGGFGNPVPGESGSGVDPAAGAAYPELPAGPARRALPATPAAGPVPGPRLPSDAAPSAAGAGPGTPPAQPVDPMRELELARQAVDGADVMIVQVETMAQQAPLFPSMSPLARATTVYLSCAGLLTVVIWIVLTVAEVQGMKGLDASTFAVFSWSCAGLPTMVFFLGYLALSVWGKPRMIVGRPARYARLGFLICFLAAPFAFLTYYLV